MYRYLAWYHWVPILYDIRFVSFKGLIQASQSTDKLFTERFTKLHVSANNKVSIFLTAKQA